MGLSTHKRVLIVDDKEFWKDIFTRKFANTAKKRADCPYSFQVDAETSLEGGIEQIRAASARGEPYDVVVFDLLFGVDPTRPEGLQGVMGFGLAHESTEDLPVIIVFTGHPTFISCVEAIRNGAWDYIVKEDRGERSGDQVVVDSAIDRLLELDLRKTLRDEISVKWYPSNKSALSQHEGKLVALWHRPAVHIIEVGGDSFDLEIKLQPWRLKHPAWHQPFILKVPPPLPEDESEQPS